MDSLNEASRDNVHRGAYNESRFAFHVNGGKHINSEHKKQEEHHKSKLSPEDHKEQDDRAKHMAHTFIEHHAEHEGYKGVDKVHITAKRGDIKKHTGLDISHRDNPSDVVVKFKKKPASAPHHYVGASLKSSRQKNISFHAGGTETLSKKIGIHKEAMKTVKDRHSDLRKKMKIPESHSAKAAQDHIKKNYRVHTDKAAKLKKDGKHTAHANYIKKHKKALSDHKMAVEHTQRTNELLRNHVHNGYKKMHVDHVKNHLIKNYLKASDKHNSLPYKKVHGMGGGDKEAVSFVHDPHGHMLSSIKNAKKIEFKKRGHDKTEIHADGEKVFHLRTKHNGGPLYSTKIQAEGQKE